MNTMMGLLFGCKLLITTVAHSSTRISRGYGTGSGSDLSLSECAPAASDRSLPLPVPYPRPSVHSATSASNLAPSYRLLIKKAARQLHLYQLDNEQEKLLQTYAIALGNTPTGHKRRQGDGATPEGDYYITHKNARSKFYLSLGLSYPNLRDADEGLQQGLITEAEHAAIARAIGRREKPPQQTRLGGDIFIHGGGMGRDWTLGCVALENEEIKELFDLLPVRTPVKIVP